MALDQSKSNRKATGGRLIDHRKKRKSDLGSKPILSKVGVTKKRADRVLGGNIKSRLLTVDIVNIMDPKTKKCVVGKIKSVMESPANRHFVRRNIITKGTIIDTDKGKAKVTSRPGQESAINAILVE